MSNVLVVNYSRTGTTRAAADRLAQMLRADVDTIHEPRGRGGIVGYLRSSFEAMLSREPAIELPGRDPTRYELVVVATPIWYFSLASPVRSYLRAHGRNIRRLALLITCGGRGAEHLERQVTELCGRPPIATAVLTDSDRSSGTDESKLEALASQLRGGPGSVFARGSGEPVLLHPSVKRISTA